VNTSLLIKNTSSRKSDFFLEKLYKNRGKKDEIVILNPLNLEEQFILITKILNNIFSVDIDGKNQLILHIGNGNILYIEKNYKNFFTNLKMHFRDVEKDGFTTLNLNKLFELLKSRKRYKYNKAISVFFKENRLIVDEENDELINEIKIDYHFDGLEIDVTIYNEIVNEINKHWQGYILTIIDHLVAGQYVSDKKNLWLLIMADSNFGKSKLFKWIEPFGGSAFVDFLDLKSDGISNKDPKEYMGKICLVIDEVLKFSREMFKIEEYLTVRPMRNHAIKIPIGSRIMLSADGGVFNADFLEKQIQNRVAKIDLRECKTEDLGELEITKKYGEYSIGKVMELYLYREIFNRINEYEKLNKKDKADRASAIIKNIFKNNKFDVIDFFEKVEESIYEILENDEVLDKFHREILQEAKVRVDNKNRNGWLILRAKTVIPLILTNYDKALEFEMKFKTISQISEKIKNFEHPKNGLTIDGRKMKGLFISDKKKNIDEVPTFYETIDKNGNVISK